ncbi:MAG: hypothetical protein ABS75_29070 [Pelagibacterium sp. SCN 63-23]|nr:MAG: hypothetical protein ABS75_29070 [Pelagibacterium sp. SCN 63-23]
MTHAIPLRRATLDVSSVLPDDLLAQFANGASARDQNRVLPYAEVDQLKATRFGAVRLPVEEGGAGALISDVVANALRLASADSNIAHIWRNHAMLTERLVVKKSTNPVLKQLRDDVARGALIGLAGAESVRTQTGGPGVALSQVIRDGHGYRFSARKVYSTGSIFADWIVTYAELEDGIRVSLVLPRDREGITLIDDWDGMGQKLTGTGTTVFDNVAISEDEIIRPESLHPHITFMSSTVAQLVLTAVIAGITQAIARDAADLLGKRDRTFYFAPAEHAGDDPLLLAALGERQADAFATEAIVLAAARALDRASDAIEGGDDAFAAVEAAALAAAKAKVSVDAIAQRAGSALFDIAGASATTQRHNLDRHWRNLRTVASHNPASYKAFAIGGNLLNGTPVPSMGFF